jgi:hypothetical protein
MLPAVHVLAIGLVLASSCVPRRVHRNEEPIPTPPREDAPVEAEPVETQADCSTLARAECMASSRCVLVLLRPDDEIDYACREAENDCERGLRQDRLTQNGGAACTERDGCAYRAGQCYCACHDAGRTAVPDLPSAPACDCECAGGPPPACEPD